MFTFNFISLKLLIILYVSNLILHSCYGSQSRIVGGLAIKIEMVKYQVSIRLEHNDVVYGIGHICGGTLISDYLVLTAAHCLHDNTRLRDANEFRIVAGETALFENTKSSFVTSVLNIIVHPDYSCINFHNDIAIMTLKKKIPTDSTTIAPINLRTFEAKVGTQCLISGWGTTSYGGVVSPVLRGANLVIQDLQICNGSNSYDGILKNEMICAGPMEGGVDSCQGDSGGPLVCENTLVGVVSNGNKCALPNTPGIYSDVRKYVNWIMLNSAFRINVNKTLISIIVIIYFFS